MREMIFNQASLAVPAAALAVVVPLLEDVAQGMAKLVRAKCASPVLRSQEQWYAIPCARNGSLFDALNELRAAGARDAALFLMHLVQKTPLLTDLGDGVVGRLLGCQAIEIEEPYGQALVLCAHIGAIAVSLPLTPAWDSSTLEIAFAELLESGEIDESTESVDNLARSVHSATILERDRSVALADVAQASIWNDRARLFPKLLFSPDVEAQLQALNPGLFKTVVNRLADLDASARAWQRIGGGVPPWTCKVSPESDGVMNNRKLREARRFRSASGESVIFEWHARFGSSGRIHFRFDPANTTIEVGYVGGHLPLP